MNDFIKEQHAPSCSDKQKQYDSINDIESLRLERIRIHDTIRRNNTMRDRLYIRNRHRIKFHPVAEFVIYWIIELLVVLFLVLFVVQNPGEFFVGELVLVFIVILIAALNLIFVYPKIRKIKKIDLVNKELYAESQIIDDKIKALEREDK